MTDWVSTKDEEKLPPFEQKVLIGDAKDKYKFTSIGTRYPGRKFETNEKYHWSVMENGYDSDEYSPDEITHWMPLPELPEVS